jgi:predicted metal-dependent hydrolase
MVMPERHAVALDGSVIEYEVVRSRRRRRTIEITVDPRAGVRVAAPLRTTYDEIRSVVRHRAEWIARQQRAAVAPPAREFVTGESVPLLGQAVPLLVEVAGRKRVAVAFEHEHLHIDVPRGLEGNERRAAIEVALTRWFGEQAALHLEARVAKWAAVAGRHPARVLIRNQRQRWGSCARDGTLRFNWRIVMADLEVLDYVAVHELAHLAVRNHSPGFWAEVERVLPDYRERKHALKRVGPTLTL